MNRSTTRSVLVLVTGLLVTAGLLATTTAPAHAGQVGVTTAIQGAGTVEVVEGWVEDPATRTCARTDNQDHRVTVTCPRIRSEASFEAWIWLRATPAPQPAGEWRFDGWSGCDTTRVKDGHTECAVHSGAFSSDEKTPVARFRDVVAPTVNGLQVVQVPDVDRRFQLRFGTSGATTECRSVNRFDWLACASGDVWSLYEGTHLVQVRATDRSGNVGTSEVSVTSVDTWISRGPERHTQDPTSDFRLHTGAGDEFYCSLDEQPYVRCGGGTVQDLSLGSLSEGEHLLEVKARWGAWVDPVPSRWTWTIDRVAPTSTLTADIQGTSATFRTASSESAFLECKLDTPAGPGRWDWCASPTTYTRLEQGEHVFSSRVRDYAGNVQVAPPSYRWTVDTVAPATTLVATPSADRVTFAFTSAEATSYECRLTTPTGPGTWGRCTSPTTYTGLAAGGHRFEARATDAAGNVEAAPATYAWTATAPAPGTQPEPVPVVQPSPPPGTTPLPGEAQATSTTKAAWRVSAARAGRVTVTVASIAAPSGRVVIRDNGRVIARATLEAAHRGRVVVRLPKLRRGKHVLVARYLGSGATRPSSSTKRVMRLR